MEYDEKLLDTLPDKISWLYEPILFIKKVESLKANNKVGHRVFLATNFGAYLYKPKFYKKTVVFDVCIPWAELKSISTKSKNEVEFKYSRGLFRWRDPDSKKMTQVIVQTIVNVLLPRELPNFNVNFDIPPPDISGAEFPHYKRLLYKIREFNATPTPKFLKSFKTYCRRIVKRKDIVFDFSQLEDVDKNIDILFEVITAFSSVKHLDLNVKKSCNIWRSLANFLRKSEQISGIYLHESNYFNDFAQVIKAIENNRKSKITTLQLIDISLTEQIVEYIEHIMRVRRISILCFKKCIENGLLVKVFNADPKNFQFLVRLQINGIPGFSPHELIPLLPNLDTIDFSYNDVDIQDTISTIVRTKGLKLRHIIFSGNKCTKKLGSTRRFPSHLNSLRGSSVEWTGKTLLSYIRALGNTHLRAEDQFCLEINNIKMDQSNFEYFFNKIQYFPIPQMHTIRYSENPVHPNFFEFLMQSENLITLNLSGCFPPRYIGVDYFCDFISKNETVTKLCMQGTSRNKMESKTAAKIFQVLASRKIKQLDIRDNIIGDEIFDILRDFYDQNTDLDILLYDHNKIKDFKACKHFIDFMRHRKIRATLQTPFDDLKALIMKHKMRGKDLKQIIKDCETIREFKATQFTNKNDDSPTTTYAETTFARNVTSAEDFEISFSDEYFEMPLNDEDTDNQNMINESKIDLNREQMESAFETQQMESQMDDSESSSISNGKNQKISLKDGRKESVGQYSIPINVVPSTFDDVADPAPIPLLPDPSAPPEQENDDLTNSSSFKFIGRVKWEDAEKFFVDDTDFYITFHNDFQKVDRSAVANTAFENEFSFTRLSACM